MQIESTKRAELGPTIWVHRYLFFQIPQHTRACNIHLEKRKPCLPTTIRWDVSRPVCSFSTWPDCRGESTRFAVPAFLKNVVLFLWNRTKESKSKFLKVFLSLAGRLNLAKFNLAAGLCWVCFNKLVYGKTERTHKLDARRKNRQCCACEFSANCFNLVRWIRI